MASVLFNYVLNKIKINKIKITPAHSSVNKEQYHFAFSEAT